MEQDSNQPSSKLLEPVNLVLSVKRNLAASWYQKMAAIEVDGDLKPMKVCSHNVRTSHYMQTLNEACGILFCLVHFCDLVIINII